MAEEEAGGLILWSTNTNTRDYTTLYTRYTTLYIYIYIYIYTHTHIYVYICIHSIYIYYVVYHLLRIILILTPDSILGAFIWAQVIFTMNPF